ncbi:hypothetical protein ACLOJK_012350 [Asimina triloba]
MGRTSPWTLMLVLLLATAECLCSVRGDTDPKDAASLRSLKDQWENTPPSWGRSDDPCGSGWEGVNCTDSRVIELRLSSMGIKGTLGGDIGQLTELITLDLSSNRDMTGQLSPMIGNLKKLTILILQGCSFTGRIPDELGNLPLLSFLALNSNNFTGPIPASLGRLSNLYWLDLAENQLNGPLPVSTRGSPSPGLDQLLHAKHLLLDGNNFTGNIPNTLGLVQSLEVLRLDRNLLSGPVPPNIDNLTSLVCVELSNLKYCQPQQQTALPYSTSLASCRGKACPDGQKLCPLKCDCAYPYEGTLYFRAPSFRDLSNSTMFQALETSLWTVLGLSPGAVSLQNPFFNVDQYLQVSLQLFPSPRKCFNRTTIQTLGFYLTNQTFKPPPLFGPYYFLAQPYTFPDGSGGSSISTPVIAVIAIGCTFLVMGLVAVGIYAIRQKKRAERAIQLSKPFASWAPSGKDSGAAPQLKGARWFSYQELKKSTNNFSEMNEIGSGGYGKVYKGTLPDNQMVAIKRAQQGSMQGALEFKTEIELLSRVHHKNLVGLVGFCFEQGEQMLVYEYIPNGTLRESLSERSNIQLDWKRRLRITLGSAKGLAYLHELANPPIIHRDVKSTNILLDESLSAKVSDFGLSKLVSDSGKGHVSTQVKGTLGYLDPEYYMTQQLTDKSDVYSFGVVMLEMITAKQPIEKRKYIVREVRMAMNINAELYGLKELVDPAIRDAPNLIGFGRFVELAMQSVEESAADRPTMSELVKEIEAILQNDGMNTNSTSASSSATEFGTTKGAHRHPYNDPLPKRHAYTDSFDYSGGYTFSTKIEPK